MAWVEWRSVRHEYCERAGEGVDLEAQVAYPSDVQPDQPPRVLSHRCSLGVACNQFDRPTCCWAGTQPDHDPFR
jgi:hypothetical protein